MTLVTLKKRAEFLRLRGGARWATGAFVLETKPRSQDMLPATEGPRVGFTVTKALGGAVIRNRIRRRLKAAVGELLSQCSQSGHDYVIIARASARDRSFCDLKKDLEQAFQRVHHPASRRGKRGEA